MDDFGMLAKDFGFRPQGKSAPMKSSGGDRRSRPAASSTTFATEGNDIFGEFYGGPPKYSNINSKSTSSMTDFDYDSIFKDSVSANNSEATMKPTSSNSPVYDKPLYDDDIFDGLPGVKSKPVSSSSVRYEDNIFASMTTSPPKQSQNSDHFDDLLGNLGRTDKAEPTRHHGDKSPRGLDDLIPGFGSGSPTSSNRWNSEPSPKSTDKTKDTPNAVDDPFVVLESMSTPVASSQGLFTDPLEDISKMGKSRSTKAGASTSSGDVFGDIDSLNGFDKSAPAFAKEINNRGKGQSILEEGSSMGSARSSASREPIEESSFGYSESQQQQTPFDDFQESHQTVFDMPTVSRSSRRSFDQATSASHTETASQVGTSPKSEEHVQHADDIWLTVSEIPLFTPVTRAPPPSRSPPPIPRHASKSERGSFASSARAHGNNSSSSSKSSKHHQSARPSRSATKSPVSSQLDDLEHFAMGRMPNNSDDHSNAQSGEEMDTTAASMKEAIDRAETKFKHAKEARKREHVNASNNKEHVHADRDEQAIDEEITRERLARERQEREREEEEKEQRRLEKERMKEIEREKARQAVERATREARERAASEARLKAERAAVQRAQAEARERAAVEARERAERAAAEAREKEAREKAAAESREKEAREKAAAESREKAAREKAAAESREKEAREKAAVARAQEEARRRAERAAVERVTAEARERAAAEARERAAAEARERAAATAAKMNQQKTTDNDLDSFFSMGSRPSSAPKSRATSASATDPLSQYRQGPEGTQRASSTGVPSNVRKVSSTNFVDDLSSIFGAATPAGEFQDIEGETEERRRARLEREQRTQERAAKALAEKNQRDLQSQKEQEERHRISATLDVEIKRWAAGKEGNLRAMLSTLQYVLWPECGWQPISLTDLITGVSVKKAYRKATLCIHPDKVQQKGASLQQKYVAEKVFDLLKEAWNKFNSEELF